MAETSRSRRELPRVVAGALRLLWAAGRGQLPTVVAVEAVAAVGVAAAVLLGREVLAGVLEADPTGGGWTGFVGPVVALAAVSTLLTVAHALASRQQQLLTELAGRHAQARIHDVACAVELAAFDDPSFHDRVGRAQSGAFRISNIVHGPDTRRSSGRCPWPASTCRSGSGRRSSSRACSSVTRRSCSSTDRGARRACRARAVRAHPRAVRHPLGARHLAPLLDRARGRTDLRARRRRGHRGGHYAEVMARGGTYAELFRLQASAYAG